MPKQNYDENEFRYFRDHTGQERLDEGGSLFLARELDALRARVYEMETPALNALNIFSVQSEAAGWQDTLTFGLISDFGMARIISDYADNIPMVGVYGQWLTVAIYTIADAYAFSMKEIEKAQATGKGLTDRLATAARRGMDAKINDLVWNGDEDYNIIGIFDNPNINYQAAQRHPTTGNPTTGSWQTGNDAMQDLIIAIQGILTTTKGLHQANAIVLPVSAASILTQQLPNTNVSYKTFLTQENPGLSITYAQELEDIDGNGTKGALVFEKSADVAAVELSQPFRQHPAQWNNLHAKVVCDARTAGLIVYKPICITLIYGL